MTTITNLWQSLLCLDLNHITGSDNCSTAMESLAHAVDKNDIKYYKRHYFALFCQNKIRQDFYTHCRNFVTGQIRRSKKDYYGHNFNGAKNDIKQT